MRLTFIGSVLLVSSSALAQTTDAQPQTPPSGMEVVRIKEEVPAVITKPQVLDQTATVRRLPRSDELIETNEGAIVWLMTTVDARGIVTDARVMKSPAGLNLDGIAADEAKTLRFQPALDADGKPTSSHVVVKVEWQPYWPQLMGELWDAPCRGQGPLNLGLMLPTYRVCD
jgi:hypothetical protein